MRTCRGVPTLPCTRHFSAATRTSFWGVHPSLISADWARERISLLDLRDIALRLVGLRRSMVLSHARQTMKR
jgi:hypothetical protein